MVRTLIKLVILFLFGSVQAEWLYAQQIEKKPFDQLAVSEVACGPSAALNVLRYSKGKWNKALSKYNQETDAQTLRYSIYKKASVSSRTRPGAQLWSEKDMMNAEDYVDYLNSFKRGMFWQEKYKRKDLRKRDGGEASSLLYDSITRSLERGGAPTLELVMYVNASEFNIDGGKWVPFSGHFLVVLGVNKVGDRLDIKVADSYGGRQYEIQVQGKTSVGDAPALLVKSKRFTFFKKLQREFKDYQFSISGVVGM